MRYRPEALRALRKLKGLSIEEVARKARVSLTQAYMIDRGVGVPRADTLGRLAHALGVPLDEFFRTTNGRKVG